MSLQSATAIKSNKLLLLSSNCCLNSNWFFVHVKIGTEMVVSAVIISPTIAALATPRDTSNNGTRLLIGLLEIGLLE